MVPDDRFLFVLGGARSGKSDFALRRGLAWPGPVTFIATATALDDDMSRRIDRHQEERPDHWGLIEEPLDLVGAIKAADSVRVTDVPNATGTTPTTEPVVTLDDRVAHKRLVIVDCLTVWTSNLLFDGQAEADVLAQATEVGVALQARNAPAVVISNEVGLGVHPETELGRTYRDQLGRVNQVVAAAADRAFFFAAGRAFELIDPADLLDPPR